MTIYIYILLALATSSSTWYCIFHYGVLFVLVLEKAFRYIELGSLYDHNMRTLYKYSKQNGRHDLKHVGKHDRSADSPPQNSRIDSASRIHEPEARAVLKNSELNACIAFA